MLSDQNHLPHSIESSLVAEKYIVSSKELSPEVFDKFRHTYVLTSKWLIIRGLCADESPTSGISAYSAILGKHPEQDKYVLYIEHKDDMIYDSVNVVATMERETALKIAEFLGLDINAFKTDSIVQSSQ